MPSTTEILQGLTDKYLVLFDNMPPVKVAIQDDPHFQESNSIGFWRSHEKTIYIRPDYLKKGTFEDMLDTVKHELTHAWITHKKLDTEENGGHNEAFIKKAIELKLNLSGTLQAFPGAREIYNRLKGIVPIRVPVTQSRNSRRKCYDASKGWMHPIEFRLLDTFFIYNKPLTDRKNIPQYVVDGLQTIADDLLPLFDNMPSVKVVVEYSEYRFAKPTSYYDGNIVIMTSADRLTSLIKFHLINAWLDWRGCFEEEAFKRKAIEVGID